MIDYILNIGDVVVSSQRAKYTCFGLGSCVGLFVQDRVMGLSGGAHIFLPDNTEAPVERNKFYSVTSALNKLLNEFKLLGSSLLFLRAKIVGGSNVIGVNVQMGRHNSESVVSQLIANRIFIAARDVGGNFCRTAKFHGDTGQLIVWMPQTKEHKIY